MFCGQCGGRNLTKQCTGVQGVCNICGQYGHYLSFCEESAFLRIVAGSIWRIVTETEYLCSVLTRSAQLDQNHLSSIRTAQLDQINTALSDQHSSIGSAQLDLDQHSSIPIAQLDPISIARSR
ncbi:hypothetical protein F511_11249 [Dorcoceras hygrometricum]|uniref:CCHC-type domain-containing protein n=1 Tax=Dorcoceras hygrometricum TaxID=472368 RepID=A0A2Z7DE35_9LAMI|nr:hypothetical protein F511_11249 [Dorcoceras hygrometricum]